MAFSLGPEANAWNEAAQSADKAFYAVRQDLYNTLHCERMAETSATEHRVLCGIVGRTLRFRKYAEAIPAETFTNGLTDSFAPDIHIRDNFARPYFGGCGIRKTDTVYKAIGGLEEKGFIEVWRPAKTRYANVYMPFSEDWFVRTTLIHQNRLPNFLLHKQRGRYADIGGYPAVIIDFEEGQHVLVEFLDEQLEAIEGPRAARVADVRMIFFSKSEMEEYFCN